MNSVIKKIFAFAITCLMLEGQAYAQVTTQNLIWHRFDVTAKLPRKFRISLELNERYYAVPAAQHQLVLRSNVFYDLKHHWTAFSGYTYFLQSPNDPESTTNLVVPEHRLQHGFMHHQDYGKVALVQRLQIEERFFRNATKTELIEGHRFVFRFRYRMFVDIKLLNRNEDKPKGDWVLRVGDEIHLQAGQSIKGQPFDQNRAMAFLQYFITNNLSVDIGYINWYQQRSGSQGFYNRHIFTTGLQAKLDFSKKPPKPDNPK
jgi:hypothetical protein